jgi:hypothetical protein
MFFLKNVGGRCGCVYGTKGAVDRKKVLETTGLEGQAVETMRSFETSGTTHPTPRYHIPKDLKIQFP